MRIALDARQMTSRTSGIGSHSLNLVRALLEEDKDIELLLVCNTTRKQQRLQNPRVEEVFFPFPHTSPLTQLPLGAFLRRQTFDVFHVPFVAVAPRGLHRPLVATVHDLDWAINPRYASHNPFFRLIGGAYYRVALASTMREASRILAVSHATRHALLEYAPWYEAKSRVTYNGIDRSRIYPLEKEAAYRLLAPLIAPGTPFVFTVGQGRPYKNHLNAVRGFLQAFGDRREYRMILVRRSLGGELGQDRALQALLQSPQAQAQVLTLPYVTPEVLNALYNAARIVLHPSYYEGFGLPLIEAMAVGTPLITSSVSAMPEVAGRAALLVPPADYRAIAEALVTLDQDETVRQRLIAEGHRQIERFSWSTCAQATLAVYRELL